MDISRRSLTATLTVSCAAAAMAGGMLAATSPAVSATGKAAACQPDSLYVVKGRLDAGAGQRYLPIKVTNVGDEPCSLSTATKVRFRDFDGPLGKASLPQQGTHTVTLAPGKTVRTVVHWSDPGPVPADQCDAADATLVTLRLPALHHTWRIPQQAEVCTTAQYRPDATALK